MYGHWRAFKESHQLLDHVTPFHVDSNSFSERPVTIEQIARFHNPEEHSEDILSPENLESYLYMHLSAIKTKEILDPANVYVCNNTLRPVVH